VIRTLRRIGGDERGNATVGFALVTPMLIAVALAVVQLALTLHVRTTLAAAAAEGARAAALSGSDAAAGERRTRAILEGNIAAGSVQQVTVQRELRSGVLVVSVRIDARLPLLGMLGPTAMQVEGHALQEFA